MEQIQKSKMMSIRQIARTGILTEHALRVLLKAGKLPAVYIGRKALINYDVLCAQLDALQSSVPQRIETNLFGQEQRGWNYRS